MIDDKDLLQMIENVKKALELGSFDEARVYIESYCGANYKLDTATSDTLRALANKNHQGDAMMALILSLEDGRPAAPTKAPTAARFQQAADEFAAAERKRAADEAANLRFIQEDKKREEAKRIAEQKRAENETARYLKAEEASKKTERLKREQKDAEEARRLAETDKHESAERDAAMAAVIHAELNRQPVVDIEADGALAEQLQRREQEAQAVRNRQAREFHQMFNNRDDDAGLAQAFIDALGGGGDAALINGLTPEQQAVMAAIDANGGVVEERKRVKEAEHQKAKGGPFKKPEFKGITISDDGVKAIEAALTNKDPAILLLLGIKEAKEIENICPNDPLTQTIILDPVAMYCPENGKYEFFERATAHWQQYHAPVGQAPKSLQSTLFLEDKLITEADKPDGKDATHGAAIQHIKKMRDNLTKLKNAYEPKAQPAKKPGARQ